jgi:predicted DNA binding CopG/RHH family protein
VIDLDAPEYRAVDWDRLPRHEVDLDPALVEHIRARSRLRQITLRVGEEQIAEARRIAAATGEKYQSVMRRWLAAGASRERRERLQGSRKRGSAR